MSQNFLKRHCVLSGALAVAVLSFIVFWSSVQKDKLSDKGQANEELKTSSISIGHKKIKAFVVDTPASRQKGLGARDSIAKNTAMLFVFDTPNFYQIWMKDMRFPIDIFWLQEARVVVDIKENVSPSTFPEIFSPISPALYVLEANAGFAKENSIKIGDKIYFSLDK